MINKILVGNETCRRFDLKRALEEDGHIVCVGNEEPFAMFGKLTECNPSILIISSGMKERGTLLGHINGSYGNVYTLVIARPEDTNTIDLVMEGIDRILSEPCSTADICKMIDGDIESGRVKGMTYVSEIESVSEIMKKLGATPNYTGYRYIIDAVEIIVSKGNDQVSLTRYIYPEIGKKYNVTPNSVERSIRTVIKNTWGKCPDADIIKYFGMYAMTPSFKPSNSRYIHALAEYIINQNKRRGLVI